jgi:hypothetical protein
MPQVLDTRRSARRLLKEESEAEDAARAKTLDLPAIFVEPPIVITKEIKKRFQDMMIIRLLKVGLSVVDVGKILNMSESLVRHRIDGLPEGAAKHYASCDALGELEGV